jgi:selenocysteine lyase/cysteine desulfurase
MLSQKTTLERFFFSFRKNVVGNRQLFESPFGTKEIIYADWTASGRAYAPIEACIQEKIMPFVANTHTTSTITGTLMSDAYEEAKTIVKKHVNANSDDILLFCGSGMTAAVNKLQRILGLRLPERMTDYAPNRGLHADESLRPIVFVTEMEHHSNHISWLETIATVEVIDCGENGNVDLECFRNLLEQYKHRTTKIAAITACSNVTGIQTPIHEVAKMIHEQGGWCFVDFACSAPYVNIDMHPADTHRAYAHPPENSTHLDAIYFSPHKFLGGPGTPGVLIFNKKLYHNTVPDQPGGGTVIYTNPWNDRVYSSDIEQREDGGTPPFLQGIKAAMCIRLKEEMGVENMLHREEEMLQILFAELSKIGNLEILEAGSRKRLGIISFIIHGAHYNLIVKILNDRFGIQARGGCSCAGTYGHHLLRVSLSQSHEILNAIRAGDLHSKPGWIRLSIHPTMTNAELTFIMDAIRSTAENFKTWMQDYHYDPERNEFCFKGLDSDGNNDIHDWFSVSMWSDRPNPVKPGQ